MYTFVNRISLRTIVYLVTIWILLAVVNIAFKKAGIYDGVAGWFPISVFPDGLTIHLSGIPFLLLFLVVLAYAIRLAPKLTIYQIWLISFSLIILGNLGQGDWDSAFNKPFLYLGQQYYNDAIKVTSWSAWLESFNVNQRAILLMHTQTHPPFAVLIHYFILYISSNSLFFLSMVFVFISSLSIILVWHIFQILNVPLENRNLLALLFSVVPAVNIYSAVSLDGLILTSATLFLLGVVIVLKSIRLPMVGLLSISFGIIITNLLTYAAGIFLFAIACIQAFQEFVVNRKFNIAVALLISSSIFLAIGIALYWIYDYNYIQSFLVASALENPNGFQGWDKPYHYLATRVEDVSEIALFLSFGFLAVLFHPDKLRISYSNWRNIEVGLLLSGLITLLAIFISGAYRVGETARGVMFIYPYIMLALSKADPKMLREIIKFAGLQTVAMQLLGYYVW